jgi:hypothetical protein
MGYEGESFKIISYIPKDEIEEEMFEKYYKEDIPVAVLHCLIVGKKYTSKNLPMYKTFKKKSSNKVREIYAPEEDVKKALKHLLKPLNKAYDMRRKGTNQFAYTIGRSIKDNALIHKNHKYVIKCDIKEFFDNCNWNLVSKYLRFIIPGSIRYTESTDILKKMMINPKTNGLYLGSPVSGALTNAILKPACLYLKRIFEKEGKAFSVYADDITVSSEKPITKNEVIGKIRYVFEELKLPFKLKKEKTKRLINNGRRITGIRINHEDKMTIDRQKYRLLRSILHRIDNDKPITMEENKLLGKIAFYKFVDESGKIEKLLEKHADAFQCIKDKRVKLLMTTSNESILELEKIFN